VLKTHRYFGNNDAANSCFNPFMQRAVCYTCFFAFVSFLVSSLPVANLALSPVVVEKMPSASGSDIILIDLPADAEGETGEEDDSPGNTIVYDTNRSRVLEPSSVPNPNDPIMIDRAYLRETAVPGDTMTRQGPELAIGRLHPEFVHRLAAAIHEASQAGLPNAGIFSAYRPPAFGVGGFSDKFNSLHTYGLAVDMTGIGGAGSVEAKLWHEIAARHGVACPYGFGNHSEWNHCQPTRIKIILPANPLRQTVTADGPIDLESMFAVGDRSIESPDAVLTGFMSSGSADVDGARADIKDNQPNLSDTGNGIRSIRIAKFARLVKSGRESPSWCRHLQHPSKETCGSSHQVATAAKTQGIHPKQASNFTRHHTSTQKEEIRTKV
jgi:hypothetical protein